MAWPPVTHQDVQDAVSTLQTTAYTSRTPPPDTSDPLALTAYNPFTNAYAPPAEGQSSAAGATRVAFSDARLTYRGATEFTAGGTFPDTNYYDAASLYPHNRGSQPTWSVDFYTDAAWFEFQSKYTTASAAFRVSVDGRRVTDVAQPISTSTVGLGFPIQYRFDFPTTGARRITIDFSYMPFDGIFIPSTASMWKVPAYRDRTLVLGDSITGGSAFNVGLGIGTWLHRVALVMGWDDVWNQSIGGTGYITTNGLQSFVRATGAVTGATGTLNDIAQYTYGSGFTRVIVFGGYNDSGGSQASIQTAANTLYQNLKAAMPAAQILVIGCYTPTGTPPATHTTTDETLRVAAATAGLQFISPITGKIYNQRGSQIADHGAWITTANAAAYITTGDTVHPNDAGHAYLARRIGAAIQAINTAASTVEPWAGGLHAAIDDGEPSNDKEWNYLSGPSTVATLTPTALTITAARAWSYNCMFPIVVNRIRWFGIGATTTHRLAVYRASDGVQVIGPLSLTTTADAWNSVAVSAVTLAPNTPYIVALSTTAVGTTAGLRTGGTPLLFPPLQASTSGGLLLAGGDHRFWFGQFAVTNGVLPATLPALVRGTGWTAGLPLFYFDSNNAA